MSSTETVSLVKGIYTILEYVDFSVEQKQEHAEGLFEIKDFLMEVLQDIEASRK